MTAVVRRATGRIEVRDGSIYVLVDSRTPHHYRYVGQTVNPLAYRLRGHLKPSEQATHRHVYRWINSVVSKGGSILIIELANVPSDDLDFAECFYIAALREAGHDLTNAAPGGHSKHDRSVPEEVRARISATQKKNYASPEAREAARVRSKKAITPEVVSRIVASRRSSGSRDYTDVSEETRTKLRAANARRWSDPAERAKARTTSAQKQWATKRAKETDMPDI